MARLDPLIRVRRHRVEEKQKVLAHLYIQMEALQAEEKAREERLAAEQDLLQNNPELQMFSGFADFAKRMKEDIGALKLAQQKIEARITLAQDDLREAFADLKKVEIIQRERKEEERKKADKKEAEIMDEVGQTRHERMRKTAASANGEDH
jgi:flagellar FliJ protein